MVEINISFLDKALQKRAALTNFRLLVDKGKTQHQSDVTRLEADLEKLLKSCGGVEGFNQQIDKANDGQDLKFTTMKSPQEWP